MKRAAQSIVVLILIAFSQLSFAAWCCHYKIVEKKSGRIHSGQACTGDSKPNCQLYRDAWTNCANQRSSLSLTKDTAECRMVAHNDCNSDDGAPASSYWGKCKK